MDDNEFFGSDEIIINVADDLCNAKRYKDFGGTPYTTGPSLKPSNSNAKIFYGRDEIIKDIKRKIESTGNVVILQGNRRSGKS